MPCNRVDIHGFKATSFKAGLEFHDTADRFTIAHQLKTIIDPLKAHCMGDHGIDLDFPAHIPVNNFWYVGPSFGTAKGGATPVAAGHQLKWARGNLLAGPYRLAGARGE